MEFASSSTSTDEYGTDDRRLIEHDMGVVMGISTASSSSTTATQDRRRHAGRGAASNPDVIAAYLGTTH